MDDLKSREDRIRREAYLIWLGEGRPEGRDKDHWEAAERTVDSIEEARREDHSNVGPAV